MTFSGSINGGRVERARRRSLDRVSRESLNPASTLRRSSAMMIHLAYLIAWAYLLLTSASSEAAIWYVDLDNILGTEDGTAWATAFTTIQDGIDAATSGDEVWVA